MLGDGAAIFLDARVVVYLSMVATKERQLDVGFVDGEVNIDDELFGDECDALFPEGGGHVQVVTLGDVIQLATDVGRTAGPVS